MSVRWVPSEIEEVAAKAMSYINEGSEKSLTEALDKAQKILLQPHRWRPRESLAQRTKEYREIGQRVLDQRKVQAEANAEKLRKEQIAKAEQESKEAQIQQLLPPEPIPSEYLTQDVIEAIAQKYKFSLLERLRAVTEEAFREMEEDISLRVKQPISEATVRTKKLRVVVVGFRQDQGDHVKRQMAKNMEITTITTTDGLAMNKLKAAAEGADHILVNGKFVSHSHQDAVRQHPGFILFDGGISAAVRRLEQLSQTGK